MHAATLQPQSTFHLKRARDQSATADSVHAASPLHSSLIYIQYGLLAQSSSSHCHIQFNGPSRTNAAITPFSIIRYVQLSFSSPRCTNPSIWFGVYQGVYRLLYLCGEYLFDNLSVSSLRSHLGLVFCNIMRSSSSRL